MSAAVAQGPVGEFVRTFAQRRREELRLSLTEVSQRMADAGRPLQGERRIDADVLVALASALEVEVTDLLGLTITLDAAPPVLMPMSDDNAEGFSHADLAAVRKCSRCRCWVLPEDFDIHARRCL